MNPISALWRIFSSSRFTSALAIVAAVFTGVVLFVPQGREAMELARNANAKDLHALAAWGLTDAHESPWLKALIVLVVGNVVALILRLRALLLPRDSALGLPESAPHRASLTAKVPEAAVEILRERLRRLFSSTPIGEAVDGHRVTLVFDTTAKARLGPVFAHLGLMLLAVGVGLCLEPPAPGKTSVRALLEVKDKRTQSVGTFDMVEGEPFQFFQSQSRYILREYVAARGNMGPAIRIEQIQSDNRGSVDFWVFQSAPPDFDERHRKGALAIRALEMGHMALPGHGLASSPWLVLLGLGFSLLAFGAVSSSRAAGRVWVRFDGQEITVLGVPLARGDSGFGRSFERWVEQARLSVEA